MAGAVESEKYPFDGARFTVPDVDPMDTVGKTRDNFTFSDVLGFYEAFHQRFGAHFMDVAYKVKLESKSAYRLHLEVQRLDSYLYEFVVTVKSTEGDSSGQIVSQS